MDNNQTARTVIAEDIEIIGTIKCASDIEISGKLNGDLNCVGTAVIGEKAVIKGNITANLISIRGQINGNVTVKDRIELKASARLNGDIRAKRLTVEDGVTFVGKSEVNPTGNPLPRTSDDAPAATERAEEPEVLSAEPLTNDNRGGKSGMFTRR
ncbi:MAG: polymer-forming cytoskeletal protein [Lentisphaerae bacterium]|nr:polymer-forming cytoskeletal protein [Lentisphaerota bacterium]